VCPLLRLCSRRASLRTGIASRAKTKRPPGNRAAFSFQGRIVPTEAKIPSKLSGQNLMSRKRRVSSNFWEINVFSFSDLHNQSTIGKIVST
jgi:hypothetical protein